MPKTKKELRKELQVCLDEKEKLENFLENVLQFNTSLKEKIEQMESDFNFLKFESDGKIALLIEVNKKFQKDIEDLKKENETLKENIRNEFSD